MLLLVASQALAAEIKWLNVQRKDGHIDVHAEVIIDAPSSDVYEALIAYDQLAEMSENFTASRYIEPAPDGTPRIYTKIEGCIWFFCRTVERYARLELNPRWKITAIAEPELSDARMSIETWILSANGEQTYIAYEHEIETGFWVPPLIAGWIIGGTLKRSALETAVAIEEFANANGNANSKQADPAPADAPTTKPQPDAH